jgi:hypothetical protein
MYPGNEKTIVSVRVAKNGYVVSHSYFVEKKHGDTEGYYANDEHIFATKAEALELADSLL